jgi:periplasmic mercuric ion binding protein
MNKLLFLLFFATTNLLASAQQKKPVTVKISTPTVQCQMCKDRIEDYLKYEEGVTKVLVDFRQKKTTVTYLTDRTNLENIKTAIANAGYDAEEVKASKDAYDKLPSCCKKPSGK